MALQWKRVVDLLVGEQRPGAEAVDGFKVSDSIATPGPRIQFEVTKTLQSALNTAKIRVFNLGDANRGRIKGEFDEVILNAGYEGSAFLLFRGQIRNVGTPSDGNDDITEMDCADGDREARKSIVNFTLAAGSTDADLARQLLGAMGETKQGHVAIGSRKRLRGKVVSGNTVDYLEDLATENNAHLSIQDGRYDIVAADSTLPTEAIVISAQTGMLEAPKVDDKGVVVRCALNPRIRVNGKIKLDNHAFKLKIAKERERAIGAKKPAKPSKAKRKNLARLDPDGIYKVYKVVHKGDTRGNEWASEVFAVGLEKTIPAGRTAA